MAEVAGNRDLQRLQPLIAESLIEEPPLKLRNMASIGRNLLPRDRCPYFRLQDAACNKRVPDSGCAAIDGHNTGHAILGTSSSSAMILGVLGCILLPVHHGLWRATDSQALTVTSAKRYTCVPEADGNTGRS
jgi:hypothetical protein